MKDERVQIQFKQNQISKSRYRLYGNEPIYILKMVLNKSEQKYSAENWNTTTSFD